ncbi:PREDICTED: carbohydrate sulfotransferase 6-like [Cyprinodon variegatus]|uniref:carbohydrate sulfotransferase 6-like n=1 Tax=Cyprinodon variegatus TaxID=28743 RepID=UPI000742A8B7|nr:PREDICTED: carbohydrate sulfotransferase 6-like [Cyprinodon variegatus]
MVVRRYYGKIWQVSLLTTGRRLSRRCGRAETAESALGSPDQELQSHLKIISRSGDQLLKQQPDVSSAPEYLSACPHEPNLKTHFWICILFSGVNHGKPSRARPDEKDPCCESESKRACLAVSLTAKLLLDETQAFQKDMYKKGLQPSANHLPLDPPGSLPLLLSLNHVTETRFFELESLHPLLKDPNLDLRIIHLVRDPRAVYRSKEESALAFKTDNAIVLEHKKVPEAEENYQAMQEICQSHIRINQSATQNPPPFLRGRYKLVRYEDVTSNPLQEIQDIYEFVGLEMTDEMAAWINNMTQPKGKVKVQNAFQINSRDAVQVSQAWRTTLPHNKVKRVQEVCKEAMSLLHYKTVGSEEEQKRLDIDLYRPGKPKGFAWDPVKPPGTGSR